MSVQNRTIHTIKELFGSSTRICYKRQLYPFEKPQKQTNKEKGSTEGKDTVIPKGNKTTQKVRKLRRYEQNKLVCTIVLVHFNLSYYSPEHSYIRLTPLTSLNASSFLHTFPIDSSFVWSFALIVCDFPSFENAFQWGYEIYE